MKQRFSGKTILSVLLFIMHSQKGKIFFLLGVIFLGALIPSLVAFPMASYETMLGLILIGTGVYLSTTIGGATYKSQFSSTWLPIPMSTAEKITIILIITHLLFPLITISFTLSTAIIRSLAMVLTGSGTPLFLPFSMTILVYFILYTVLHPLYILSSYRIKNHPILAGTAIATAGVCTIGIVILAILGERTLFNILDKLIKGITQQGISIIDVATGWTVFLYVLWGISILMIPIFLWIGIYHSLDEEEKEVREP